MAAQAGSEFGEALGRAIKRKRITQASLASALHIDPSQITRWKKGQAVPHIETVARIEEELGVDLSAALEEALPEYELYLSSPITAIGQKNVKAHHGQVAEVVEVLDRHVNKVYWPGQGIESTRDLEASDIATSRNMNALAQSSALLYLQFRESHRPSGALVELGLAMGLGHKVTIILHEDISRPFMFQEGFAGVAAEVDFLPKARVYTVPSVAAACELVERNGRELLGLD